MRRVAALTFDGNGLIPVIVQDVATGEIRMFAFASREAVEKTIASGRATFWSRSRGELWEKGQTSGNPIRVKRILVDCDNDCLIYTSEPEGPSCHTGAENCFFQILGPTLEIAGHSHVPQFVLATLEAVLEERKKSSAAVSYTKSLYDGGPRAIGAKLREEAGELAAALDTHTSGAGPERVVAEAADLLYHLLVALRSQDVALREVLRELENRMGTSGHEEKARR
jgi:phosphoribosyl-AMP cyclohydrolase / phosphoribosyl-ATP pyrophosphohydrolase